MEGERERKREEEREREKETEGEGGREMSECTRRPLVKQSVLVDRPLCCSSTGFQGPVLSGRSVPGNPKRCVLMGSMYCAVGSNMLHCYSMVCMITPQASPLQVYTEDRGGNGMGFGQGWSCVSIC